MFKLGIFIGIIAITVYIALIYESTAIMLLAYAEVAFFAVSFFYLLIRQFTISGKLEVPVGISETGKENLVKIIIKNSLPLPVMRMKALLTVENTLTGEIENEWMNLPPVAVGKNYLSGKLLLKC